MKKKVFFAAIFLLGILLRLYQLGETPEGYHRDEAYAAWNAYALYHDGVDSSGHSYPVYFEAWAHGQSALNTYLMLPLMGLTGGHITPLVVRLPQVLIAILTLGIVFFLLKRMFSTETALWGMFLLAINPWHVMMSRWGLDANLAPGFLILGLFFFIKGLDKEPFFLLSALSYGLSLYCYATIWPIVPGMLAAQLLYGLCSRKIRWSKWLLLSFLILGVLAAPLLLFLLVNFQVLPEIKIGCFSIYRMSDFRETELAGSFQEIWENIKNTAYLLKNQDVGQPYDVIMPYGFFYSLGWPLLFVGGAAVLIRGVKSLCQKSFVYDWFLIIQLAGAGFVGCMISVSMHKINCLYIPLIICQAIGIQEILRGVQWVFHKAGKERLGRWCRIGLSGMLGGAYFVLLVFFQKSYYTDYKDLAAAYFQAGSQEAVEFAFGEAGRQGMNIEVNDGLKYPNILLAAEVSAKEYQNTLVYSDYKPAPSRFSHDGVTFYMGIDYENISHNRVYVVYYAELDLFKDFHLTRFEDWYVAVPADINNTGQIF